MDAGRIRVSFETRGAACLIDISGELTQATESEFTARATKALGALHGPVLFDLTSLYIIDVHGARALVKILGARPAGGAGLRGCSPVVRRFFEVLGFDLPHGPIPAREVPARPQPPVTPAPSSRGEALAASARASAAKARQSATHTSDVMSRLAATYAELALNSRYRIPRKTEDRGRLLALSGRALDLSKQYQRHAASDAG